jgi:T5SS/PEP-CTERM-associated repeat protein
LAQLPGDQDDSATIDGLSSWTVDGGLDIGAAGQATVSVTNGGSLIADEDVLLGDDATSSGKLTVDGDDETMGNVPSALSYKGSLIVGDDGVGTLVVDDDGFVSFADGGTGEIDIGADPGGQGTVTVKDPGSLLEGDDLTVGGAEGVGSGSGTLNISDDGKVSVTTLSVTGTGDVEMNDGTLETDPITIDAGGKISGSGGIVGDIDDSGQIISMDGILDIDDQVIGGPVGGGELVVGSDSTLGLESSVTSGVSVRFAAGGDDEELGLGDPLSFAARQIDDFVAGDEIDLADFSYGGPTTVVLGPSATLSLEDVALQTVNLTFSADEIGTTFMMSPDGDNGTLVEINVPCYVRGTRILTDRGEIAVEDLRVGDQAITASGARRPIVWLGRRRIEPMRHRDPAAVRPVRVSAGAFGEGEPRRDLWLSPGHNIAFEDALMPISSLINGRSIVQIEQASVEYWHVELETHDILLAEGLPAESYLDCGNRAAFANGGAFVEAHPDFRPRDFGETSLPLAQGGAPVAKAKAQALARLEARGFEIVEDADAHILIDGRRIEPVRLSGRRFGFALPPDGRDIVLKSRVFVPARTAEDSADVRELGLCVGRLQVDGWTIALDRDEIFGPGWREAERRDGRFEHRWTGGAASLPAGARLVIIDLAGFGRYGRDPEERVPVVRHNASPSAGGVIPPARSSSAAVRWEESIPAR